MKSNVHKISLHNPKDLIFTLNGEIGNFQIKFSENGVTHNFPTNDQAAKGFFECLINDFKTWFDNYVNVNTDKLTDFTIEDYENLKKENEKLKDFIRRKDMKLMFEFEERMKKTKLNKIDETD